MVVCLNLVHFCKLTFVAFVGITDEIGMVFIHPDTHYFAIAVIHIFTFSKVTSKSLKNLQ